jgi:hypothetical protein
MADPTTIRTKRITELEQSNPLYGDEVFPILQEGVTKRANTESINQYISRQGASTWVYGNSARQMSAASWVNSVSSSTSTASTWVFSNSAIEKQTSELVLLSADNWKTAYEFSIGIVSGGVGSTLLGSDAVGTINIQNGAVTPQKLSTGSPSWNNTSFTINSSSVYINPSINSDTSVFLNNNNFNKNSNIIHKGTGELNITSQTAGGDIVIQTLKDSDILFRTNDILRGSIDGETGVAKFNYGIEIPIGYKLIVPTIEASNMTVSTNFDIGTIPQTSLKVKSGGNLEFQNSTPATAFYAGLVGSNKFNIFNNLNSKTAIYIDENNNVGIGTTTPASKLDVFADVLGINVGDRLELARFTNTNTNNNRFRIYQRRFANGSTWTTAETRIQQTTDTTDQTYISFNPDGNGAFAIGTGSPAAERIRIDPLGNTTVNGNITVNGSISNVTGDANITGIITTSGDIRLDNAKTIKSKNSGGTYNDILFLSNSNVTHLQGNNIYFRTLAGSNLGYFDASGNLTTIGDVAAFSDEKLKKNVKTIKNALDKVKRLRGVEYERKDIDKKGLGFIAQEVEKILPELVSQHDDFKTVSYANVVSVLVEAIKELSNEIEILKSKIP